MSSTPSQYGDFGPRPDPRQDPRDPSRPTGDSISPHDGIQRPDERGYMPPDDSTASPRNANNPANPDHTNRPYDPAFHSTPRPQPHAPPTYPPPPLAVPYGYTPPFGSAPPTHPVLVLGAPQSNGMGIAGFVTSLVSLIACGGVLWPVSLGLSVAGMKREPKGLAIAGVVLSAISAMLFFVMFLPFFLIPFIIGMGAATTSGRDRAEQALLAITVQNEYASTGVMPASIAALRGVNQSMTTDRWNTPYRLTLGQNGAFSVDSAGPDKAFDTLDDIIHPASVTPPPAAAQPASNPAAPGEPTPDQPATPDSPEPDPTEDP